MIKNTKYKILVIILVVIVLSTAGFFITSKRKAPQQDLATSVKELPLKVESTPLSFNIVKNQSGNVLECVYTNNSEEDISRITLVVKLKDTGEIIEIKNNEAVEAGKESTKFTGKAPASGKVGDVEVLKYKISTRKGVYMEYDTELKQYNWS